MHKFRGEKFWKLNAPWRTTESRRMCARANPDVDGCAGAASRVTGMWGAGHPLRGSGPGPLKIPLPAGRRAQCAVPRHRPPSELQPHQISRPGLRAVAGSIVVAEPLPLACRVGSRRLRCVSPSSWWAVADRRLTCAWQCGGSDVLLPIGCIIVRYNTSSCVQERRSRARRHGVVLWDVVVYMYWVVRIVCRRITYHVKHTPPSVQR